MTDEVFNINFKKLAILWLPTFLRKSLLMNFVAVLVAPLESLYIIFLRVRKKNLIQVKTTCQKFSIQKRLNDEFDPLERRIKIVPAVIYNGTYLYTESEDDTQHTKTKWLHTANPIYLRTESELYSEFDFIVEIPNTGINEYRLKGEIEYYMLQSKNYKIEII
ncbi:hypothetical protein [Amniculibacterium sp. G2-70]|uniref:hypothetical protein n=1 Tax=Amniculibacterium sp. G2-70 TaxID=2767188 RepID=UPI0016547B4F|nr:hypothetical protein [Amniculibacterium sp. G2-70]